MNKPHWELKHDWWLGDIRFELEQIWAFKLMLRQHPDDEIGTLLRSVLKNCHKSLDAVRTAYAKIYGSKPNIRKIREEVEKKDIITVKEKKCANTSQE